MIARLVVSFFLAFAACFVATAQTDAQNKQEDSPEFYQPLKRDMEGWTIHYDPKLDLAENKETSERTFKALANHLQRVVLIVPEDKLKQLRTCKIWVDLEHPKLKGMQYHPSRRWLIENDCDPQLEKHVHIPVARQLYARQMWAQHPYVVLHELAHAYHDQFLDFDNPDIQAAFDSVKKAGIYESVLNHQGNQVTHYGMNNAKEYFAEMTEAYFGVNDFFPFVRAELKTHDPEMFHLLKKIWGKVD